MKKHILIILLALLPLSLYGNSVKNHIDNFTVDQVKQSLLPSTSWVKLPDYTDREAWNKLVTNINKDSLLNEANKLLDFQWVVTPASAYLAFEKTGNREVMEDSLNKNVRVIATLMLAELVDGKKTYLDKLIDGVFFLSEMTSWSLSAHNILQPSGRSLPSNTYHVVDLVAGDIGSLMSWIYYFFHEEFDKVDREISRRLKSEIKERILDPFMNGEQFWWIALGEYDRHMVNNWNPWCNSNVLQTALLIEEDEELRAEIVHKTIRSVEKFFRASKDDGACEEGPSYWGHAAGKAYDYLQVLYDASDGKINFFDLPLVKLLGEYISNSYIGDKWVVNFSDAEARVNLDYRHIYRYGKAVNSSDMKSFAAYLQQVQPLAIPVNRDAVRLLYSLGLDTEIMNEMPEHPQNEFVSYPLTQFYYYRRGDVFLAVKGGHNDVSHNHNDIGTFILFKNDQPLLIDAGVGTYTAKTFSSRRYDIWSMQGQNHSLPIVNGKQQMVGKKYYAQDIQAKKNSISLDLSKAYPQDAQIEKWTRSFDLKKGELVISDKFTLNEFKAANQIVFMTWKEPKVDNNQVLINSDLESARIQFSSDKFTVKVEKMEMDDPRFIKIWGQSIYRIVFTSKSGALKDNYTFKIKY